MSKYDAINIMNNYKSLIDKIGIFKNFLYLYIKVNNLTYYQKNKNKILNREKDYYENNKERLREQAKDKYRNLSEEEKNKKREYRKNRYHSMPEEKKQKLKNTKKIITSQKSISIIMNKIAF